MKRKFIGLVYSCLRAKTRIMQVSAHIRLSYFKDKMYFSYRFCRVLKYTISIATLKKYFVLIINRKFYGMKNLLHLYVLLIEAFKLIFFQSRDPQVHQESQDKRDQEDQL